MLTDKGDRGSALIKMIVEKLVRYMALVLDIDPNQDGDFNLVDTTEFLKCHRQRGKENSSATKKHPLTRLATVIYFYCSFRILVLCALHYIYDFHKIQLSRMGCADLTDSHSAPTKECSELANIVQMDKYRLKLIGTPYANLTILPECGFIYVLWITFSFFILARCCFKYWKPFDSSLIRLFIDKDREYANHINLITDEANRFEQSNINKYLYHVAEVPSFVLDTKTDSPASASDECLLNESKNNSGYRRLEVDSNISPQLRMDREILRQLITEGKLQPINRNPAWIARMRSIYLIIIILWACVLFALVYVLIFLQYGARFGLFGDIVIENDLMDQIALFENVILNCLSLISVAFYVTLFACTCIDQVFGVMIINRKFAECTEFIMIASDRFFRARRTVEGYTLSWSESRNQHQEVRQHLDKNLLYLLLQYKLMVRQMRSAKTTCRIILMCGLVILLMAPLIGYIHAPYLGDGMYLIFCAIYGMITIWFNLCIAPTCYLHSRGLDLYRNVATSLARLIELDTICNDGTGTRSTYSLANETMILSLRKVLSAPSEFAEDFTISAPGLVCTYANVVKFQVYCGLWVLMTWLINAKSRAMSREHNSYTGSLLTNPFSII